MMCNTCGCLNYTLDELVWYKYRCSHCGHVYKSTGQRSVCPECKSDKVKKSTPSVKVDSTIIDGRTYYRLAYSVNLKKTAATSILHLYFPPEFRRTKEFFGFLIVEASVRSMFTSEDLEQIKPLMRSLQTVGSASTLPGVGGDLLRASAAGDSARVKYLVEGGASVNALPSNGRGALALAALYGRESVVRYLIDRGANINPGTIAEINSPLTSAILGREVGIAEYLLAKGARANVLADSMVRPGKTDDE